MIIQIFTIFPTGLQLIFSQFVPDNQSLPHTEGVRATLILYSLGKGTQPLSLKKHGTDKFDVTDI